MKPVIGITPSLMMDIQSHGTFERFMLSSNYTNAVVAAGGIPVILPPQAGNTLELIGRLDGILFSGGADLDPSLYGDSDIHPETYDISSLRDSFELELLKVALDRDLPTLCICRGIQVLNVGLGGTLFQDVPDQFSKDLLHRQQVAGIAASEPSHPVQVRESGLLAGVYGETSIQTNSFHHQAIKDVAPNLVIEGRTDDGLVEAVSMPGQTFVLGVQWHPEMMFEAHPEHRLPFQRLIASAVSRSLTAV